MKIVGNTVVFILVYVDDILVTGNDTVQIKHLIHSLNASFALKDLGEIHYFLGIEATHTKAGLHLSQTKYINDLLRKSKMSMAKGMHTPMTSGQKLSKYGSKVLDDPQTYRQVVGALQYVTITSPEISYSINKVCQFMQSPTDEHWRAVKRILRYLKGTTTHGLLLRPSRDLSLSGFCDADWASDLDDRRSTTGLCVYFGNNLINWQAKKQQTVSRSSTGAEYCSHATIVSEIT